MPGQIEREHKELAEKRLGELAGRIGAAKHEVVLGTPHLEIVRYAAGRGLWVVVGTNGVRITEPLARRLSAEGVRGMALSLDALAPDVHDGFRAVRGAWDNTVRGAAILERVGLPFIVQTTVGRHNLTELPDIARFARDELGAKVWNLYFLVQTGRGQFVSDISADEYDRVLADLAEIQREHQGRMLVNAKCAPHYVKHLFEDDPDSPFIKSFAGGAGGCPAWMCQTGFSIWRAGSSPGNFSRKVRYSSTFFGITSK